MNRLVEICGDTNLTLHWHFEEEQGWGGTLELDDDKVITTTQWDIPESHADYDKLHRDCICTWFEDEDDWFSDCPRGSSE